MKHAGAAAKDAEVLTVIDQTEDDLRTGTFEYVTDNSE
jgi:hypothetical protein